MELLYRELTGIIVDCAVKVHKQLGPGFWNLLMKNVFITNFLRLVFQQ
jgi:hypothetical protein